MHWSDVASKGDARFRGAASGHEKSRTPFSRGTRLSMLFARLSGDVRLCPFPRLQESVDELLTEAIIKGVAADAFTLEQTKRHLVDQTGGGT